MNENSEGLTFGKILGELVMVILVVLVSVFTVSLDAQFIDRALPEMNFLKWAALAVLDFGILGWSLAFIKNAKGAIQKFTAAGFIVFDFVGVAIISAVEILTGGQTLYVVDKVAIQTWGIRGLIAWVVINLAGLLAYHLTRPSVMNEIKYNMKLDKVMGLADRKLDAKLDEIAAQVADEHSEIMLDAALRKIGARQTKDDYRQASATSTADVKIPSISKKPWKEWSRAEKDAYYAKRRAQKLQPPAEVQVSGNGADDGSGGDHFLPEQ